MTKRAKLIERFLSCPVDFHFDELLTLLSQHGFSSVQTGKTGGSRVKFENEIGVVLMLHKPHPGGIMKRYQLKQVKDILGL